MCRPTWLPVAVLAAALPPGLPGQDEAYIERLFAACARGGEAAAKAERQLLSEPDFVLPVLTRHLRDAGDPRRRVLAARLLGELGERGVPAVNPLLDAVWNHDEGVSRAALAALAEVGPWADRETRTRVGHEVFAAFRGPRSLDYDLDAKTALRGYFRMGMDPRMSVRDMTSLLKPRQNPLVLEYACILAGRRGPEAAELLPVLTRVLQGIDLELVFMLDPNDKSPAARPESIAVIVRDDIRDAAAEAILAIDPDSEAAAYVHLTRLRYSPTDLDAKRRAVVELGRLGANGRPAVPALTELLETATGRIRWEAATALGAMGPVAEAAVPALLRATREPDPLLRERARVALRQIEGR